jgi:hypothetical protein
MGDLENKMLMVLGVLLLCLLLSICFAPEKKADNNAFGFKCNKGTLGPGKGYCERVNEAPNSENGVYSNAIACIQDCGGVQPQPQPQPQYNAFGFKCVKGTLGSDKGYCERVNEAPNEENGVYSNALDCMRACGDPVKNYICAGPSGCLPIDMKANGKNIFSSVEECMYKCKKPVQNSYMHSMNNQECVNVELPPNVDVERGVFMSKEECMYKKNNLEDYLDSL